MAKIENGKIIESAREARGAEPGPTVGVVLIVSVVAVIVAFAGVFLYYFR